MKFFRFQFLISNPTYSVDDLSYDIGDIFMSLMDHASIASVDVFSEAGEKAVFLIQSNGLGIAEIEALFIEKFNEAGRNPQNYILLAPETEEV